MIFLDIKEHILQVWWESAEGKKKPYSRVLFFSLRHLKNTIMKSNTCVCPSL